jgi:hypothetical protein
MISGKIAERRWLKEPTQLQWRVTLPSAKNTQLSIIKRVGYLSIGIGIWEKSMSFRLQSTHTSI